MAQRAERGHQLAMPNRWFHMKYDSPRRGNPLLSAESDKLETGRGPTWSGSGAGDRGDGRARDKNQGRGKPTAGGTLPAAAGCVKWNFAGSEPARGGAGQTSPIAFRSRNRRIGDREVVKARFVRPVARLVTRQAVGLVGRCSEARRSGGKA